MLTQDMIDQARQADLVALAGHGLRKHGAYLTGPCPLCRGGHDRFVIKGNKWLCRHCSEGKYLDPIAVSYTHLPSPRDRTRSRMPSSA